MEFHIDGQSFTIVYFSRFFTSHTHPTIIIRQYIEKPIRLTVHSKVVVYLHINFYFLGRSKTVPFLQKKLAFAGSPSAIGLAQMHAWLFQREEMPSWPSDCCLARQSHLHLYWLRCSSVFRYIQGLCETRLGQNTKVGLHKVKSDKKAQPCWSVKKVSIRQHCMIWEVIYKNFEIQICFLFLIDIELKQYWWSLVVCL